MSDRQLSPYSELMPVSLQEKVEMAKYFAQSDLMPGGLKSPAQVLVALQMGHELGLAPMIALNNIAVINGRPSLSSAIMEAIARNHKDFVGIKITPSGEGKERACEVVIRRRVGENIESFTGFYNLAMATEAGLYPGKKDNWDKYPERMLKARASGYASRDAFPDALAGMVSYDEAEEIPKEPRDVTPEPRDVRAEKAPDEIKKGGANARIPIADLENMLSPEETKAIDDKLTEMQAFIEENMAYLKAETVAFVDEKARGNCMRHFYRTGKEPTRYLGEMWDRMRTQVDESRAKEKEAAKKEAAEKTGQQGRGATESVKKTEGALMDEVKAKAGEAEDAEIVKEPETDEYHDELDIF